MISFLCSHCGAQLRVKPELAGASGKCPRCKKPIEVPSSEAATLPGGSGKTASGGSSNAIEQAQGRAPELDFLAPPQGADEVGRLAHYRVQKVLGQGGMGLVLLAEDTRLARPVALKVMKKAQAAIEENRVRFLREARAAAAIEHDHIVTIYEVNQDRGVPFIAMKFLVGESLEDRLNRDSKLPADDIIRVGQEIALGLAEAHERNLIHRDIKPANVWLEEGTGRVKILDFGLALACDEDIKLTQDNYLVGTPMYMSPEQAEGDREVTARSDLFSLGSVLYRCATGELPFKGRNTMQVLNALATKKPVPPRQLTPDLPAGLEKLILELLSKDPDARPRSARVVVARLEEVRNEPEGYEEVEEEEIIEDLEEVEEPEPQPRAKRKKRREPARPRGKESETAEERLTRRVITFGIIAAVAVFLLLAALIVQKTFFPRKEEGAIPENNPTRVANSGQVGPSNANR